MAMLLSKSDLAQVVGSRNRAKQRAWLDARGVAYTVNLRNELVVLWCNLQAAREPAAPRHAARGPTDAPNLSAFS